MRRATSSARWRAERSRSRCLATSGATSWPAPTSSSSNSPVWGTPSLDCGPQDRGNRESMAERNGNGDAPQTPTQIQRRGWGKVLKRTVKEFRDDNLTDWATALTYYGVLALFPALIALVSVIGLVGQSTVDALISNIQAIPGAGDAKNIIINAIKNISSHRGAAGLAFILGLAIALWSASSYVGAFIRASNAIYEVGEGRPFYRLRP